MTTIYTSTYRYPQGDRLDITVKGQHPFGKIFAPSWDMVMGVKNGTLSHDGYTALYNSLLTRVPEEYYIEMLKYPRLTLVCFCRPHTFCHRVLLAQHLVQKGGFEYHGEI